MTPNSETELAALIRDANGPLRIKGGGTRPIGRPTSGDALSTNALSGITLYDPGALTLVVQAGTPVAEIEETLARENQRLAFEPMDHRTLLDTTGIPTIGGAVAANVSGPRRIAVGACRDFVLGVRFVDGAGNIVKNGGRVMKNVTGYDLVKLMAGSYGTLGVLTEVSLKVLPQVATSASLVLPNLDDATAVQAMSAALSSPYEVTGVAKTGNDTVFRLEGFTDSVGYRTGELSKLLARFGAAQTLDTQQSVAKWTDIRDVNAIAKSKGDIWRLSVKPTQAADLVSRLNPEVVQYDWGGGLIWMALPRGTDPRPEMTGGHATLIRGDSELPRFHPEPSPIAAISAGLRAKFDPRGILNPGLMT